MLNECISVHVRYVAPNLYKDFHFTKLDAFITDYPNWNNEYKNKKEKKEIIYKNIMRLSREINKKLENTSKSIHHQKKASLQAASWFHSARTRLYRTASPGREPDGNLLHCPDVCRHKPALTVWIGLRFHTGLVRHNQIDATFNSTRLTRLALAQDTESALGLHFAILPFHCFGI